jgi:tRNA1(Val) A37 N6-methylase TrmN6
MLKEASRRRRSKIEIDEAKANEISQNQRLNQIETQNVMLQQQLLELQANSNRDTQVI